MIFFTEAAINVCKPSTILLAKDILQVGDDNGSHKGFSGAWYSRAKKVLTTVLNPDSEFLAVQKPAARSHLSPLKNVVLMSDGVNWREPFENLTLFL